MIDIEIIRKIKIIRYLNFFLKNIWNPLINHVIFIWRRHCWRNIHFSSSWIVIIAITCFTNIQLKWIWNMCLSIGWACHNILTANILASYIWNRKYSIRCHWQANYWATISDSWIIASAAGLTCYWAAWDRTATWIWVCKKHLPIA